MVGLHGDLKSVLHQIIELDYDAVAAYDAAIQRLKDTEAKAALTGFKSDHERHVREVGEELRTLGGDPPRGPDVKRVLTEGKVVIAGLIGDKAILSAMKTNEDDTNTGYERVTSRTDLTPQLQTLLHGNLEDERRHKAWIEQRIRSMSSEARQHP
jgi:rubrerythrin